MRHVIFLVAAACTLVTVSLAVAAPSTFGAASADIKVFVTASGAANEAAIWTQACVSPCTAPTPRAFAPMAYDASTKRVVLFGGLAEEFVTDTWTWDGASWTKHSPLTSPRTGAYAAIAYDEAARRVVLFNVWGETWLWDGTAKTWTQQTTAISPSPRYFASMAYDRSSRRIVLFGGWDPRTGARHNDTWTWDGATSAWTKQNPIVAPPKRERAMMATDPATGGVVLFGGAELGGGPIRNDTWTWNGTTKTWTEEHPPVSPPKRWSAAMANDDAGGRIVLFGGEDVLGPTCCAVLGDAWAWDGRLKAWTPVSSVGPQPRTSASMAYDGARRLVVLFGGLGAPLPCTQYPLCTETNWLGDTWLYGDPAADRTPPDTTITAGPSGTTSSTTATFEFSSSEAASTFACSLDGAAFTSCSSPKGYSGLAAGQHTFSVQATDAAGNTDETAASRAWTVIQPPSAPRNLTATTAATKGIVLKWAAPASNGGSAITGYRVYRATTAGAGTFLASVGSVTTYKDKATTRGQRYYYQVTAVNSAGEGPRSNEASAVAK